MKTKFNLWLLALFAAMIPAGFAFADIGAKFGPYFSNAGPTGITAPGCAPQKAQKGP